MPTHFATIDTAIAPFTTIVSDDHVIASGWTADVDELLARIDSRLRPSSAPVERRELGAVTRAVREYHHGHVEAIDTITVAQAGGPFLEHVWKVLREVRAGEPTTYTELARRAGRPSAVRAAASGCARNACALFVPCHRIVRTDGALGGFAFGLPVKRWLLDLETNASRTGA